MFKVMIQGKSVAELKHNMETFLREMNNGEGQETTRQAPVVEAPHPEKEEARPSIPVVAVVQPTVPVGSTVSQSSNDYGVDSRGLPWDERIHSVTQAKKNDGSWRYKRGVEDSQIQTVEAELATKARETQGQTVIASPSIPVVPTVSPAPSMQIVPFPAAVEIPFTPVPVAPPPVVMPAPQPVVPSAHSLATFKATLIPTLAKLVKDGKLNQEYIDSLCKHFGVDLIFKVNDQQLEEMFNNFVQYGMIVKAE
jgi:hypothetical protein